MILLDGAAVWLILFPGCETSEATTEKQVLVDIPMWM